MDTFIGLVTALGMAGLVIAPPLVLRRKFGAHWRWFAIGIVSWGLAVVVKFTLQGGAEGWAGGQRSIVMRRVGAGGLPGSGEMGAVGRDREGPHLALRRRSRKG